MVLWIRFAGFVRSLVCWLALSGGWVYAIYCLVKLGVWRLVGLLLFGLICMVCTLLCDCLLSWCCFIDCLLLADLLFVIW